MAVKELEDAIRMLEDSTRELREWLAEADALDHEILDHERPINTLESRRDTHPPKQSTD